MKVTARRSIGYATHRFHSGAAVPSTHAVSGTFTIPPSAAVSAVTIPSSTTTTSSPPTTISYPSTSFAGFGSTGGWTLGPSPGTFSVTAEDQWAYEIEHEGCEYSLWVNSKGQITSSAMDRHTEPNQTVIDALAEWCIANQYKDEGAAWFVKHAV